MRTPLYLVALIVAIASTPLDIYQINAWNVGTQKVEPWRAKLAGAAPVRRVLTLASRVRTWCAELVSVPLLASEVGEVAVDLLVPGASNLKALRQKAADINARLKVLNEKGAAHALDPDKAAGLTDEERAEVTTLKARFLAVEELRGEAERINEAERNFKIVGKDPDAEAQRRAEGTTRLETGRDLTAEEQMKQRGFFGSCLQAVRRIAVHEHTDADIKLAKMMAGPTGLNTDVASEGGFLVAPQRSSTIIQRMYNQGLIASRVNTMPIGAGSNGMKFPAIDETSRADGSRYGGIASGWLGQGNTTTAGKPKFREMDMKLRKVGAFVYTTDELIADSVALEAWVNKYLPLELQFRTEDAFINGDGSNKPQGVLNSGAVISVTRAVPSHITSDDFRAMYAKLFAPLRQQSGTCFLIDQSSEPDLDLLTIPIGTAGVLDPSFKAAGTIPGQKFPTYKNIPILTVEYMAALGTAGDLALVAFDEYLAIDKGAVDQAVSLHVAFLTDEQVFRFIYRVDGQNSWHASLTLKSTATVSSVISLT